MWKSLNVWRSYGQEYSVLFFDAYCIYLASIASRSKNDETIKNVKKFWNLRFVRYAVHRHAIFYMCRAVNSFNFFLSICVYVLCYGRPSMMGYWLHWQLVNCSNWCVVFLLSYLVNKLSLAKEQGVGTCFRWRVAGVVFWNFYSTFQMLSTARGGNEC